MKDLKKKRQAIFYMLLPLGIVPLLLFLLYKSGGMELVAAESPSGLNTELPQAINTQAEAGKMEIYQVAEQEEKKLKEQRRLDPYFDKVPEREIQEPEAEGMPIGLERKQLAIADNLKEITKLIEEPAMPKNIPAQERKKTLREPESPLNPEVEKLEKLLGNITQSQKAPDPEMEHLEGLIDKILLLQYPEMVSESREEGGMEKARVFEVKSAQRPPLPEVRPDIGIFESDIEKAFVPIESNGFYDLNTVSSMELELRPAFQAIIAEDKELVTGASVKLRLEEDLIINGMLFGAGDELSGTCRLSGERLLVKVSQLRKDNYLLPVDMEVFGLDALPGVFIPGAISRDAAKEGVNTGISGYNPVQPGFTLETQLASMGVETARGFLSKKARLVKVNVKAGHPVLLVDKS
ncbi:conjugative transposon protein TraM [Arthrospiribacter ruber]|uniref:Conjugative transposon protein TraM n=1 Tax=Arthrospiribacter ruber TaxID=2487934 RepID=A0A951M7D4_9BACT|nr:conjugative transposon protein TraM [Arthrospiribacter ruber]MBW3466841.1 conjugative transposon protein TraM [Arthrospiribacter ruber]